MTAMMLTILPVLATLIVQSLQLGLVPPRCTLDIGFALDESSSIWFKYFDDMKNTTAQLIDMLSPDHDHTHTSLMLFSDEPRVLWSLTSREGTSKELAIQKLSTAEQRAVGRTCLEKALTSARTTMFSGNQVRVDVTRAFLLISDGDGNCAYSTEVLKRAEELKRHGVIIMTVAVGTYIKTEELKEMASGPDNFIHMKDFEQLSLSVKSLFDKSCEHQHNPPQLPIPKVPVMPPDFNNNVRNHKFHFGVMLEISSTLTSNQFQIMKQIPIQLAELLMTSEHGSRMSIMDYSEHARLITNFYGLWSYDLRHIERMINRIPQSTSSSVCSERAFRLANLEMFRSDVKSDDATKILLVVTSDPNNCEGLEGLWREVETLKMKNVLVFVMTIGERVDETEATTMSSGGANHFHVSDFTHITAKYRVILQRAFYYAEGNAIKTPHQFMLHTRDVYQLSKPTDTVIIFENNQRVTDEEFDVIRSTIVYIMRMSGMSTIGSRVALVCYGETGKVIWNFNSVESMDIQVAIKKLNTVRKTSDHKACVESGLSVADSHVLTQNTMRTDVPRVAILVSVHSSNCLGIDEITRSSLSIKVKGVSIYGLAYGSQASTNEMNVICSKEHNFWEVHSVSQIYSSLFIMREALVSYTISFVNTKSVDKYPALPAASHSIDIGFIISYTSSDSQTEYQTLVDLVMNTVKDLHIGERGSRLVVMINSPEPTLLWHFEDKEAVSVDMARARLLMVRQKSEQHVCMDTSIKKAGIEMFTSESARKGVPQVLMLVSTHGGMCEDSQKLDDYIRVLENRRIIRVVVSKGTESDESILVRIASRRNFYWHVRTIREVQIKITQITSYISTHDVNIQVLSVPEPTVPPVPLPEVVTDPPHVSSKCRVEIGIIADDSLSVNSEDFDIMKTAVEKIMDMIKPSHDGAHFSFMTFSKNSILRWNFTDDEGRSLRHANARLRSVEQTKEPWTCIGRAFHLAEHVMFSPQNVRQGVQKVLILISDGENNCHTTEGRNVISILEKLKKMNIHIITVGISAGVNSVNLKNVASSPSSYFPVIHFSNFLNFVEQIVEKSCNIDEPIVPEDSGPQFDPVEHCNSRLAFMLDESSRVGAEDFTSLKTAVSKIINIFMKRPNKDENDAITSRTAVITYSDQARLLWNFDSVAGRDHTAASHALMRKTQEQSARSCSEMAMSVALEKVFQTKSNVKATSDVLFIVTSSENTCGNAILAKLKADVLKSHRVTIIVVTVGSSDTEIEWKGIASAPHYFVQRSSFADIEPIADYFTEMVCRIYPETASPPNENGDKTTTRPRFSDEYTTPAAYPPTRPPLIPPHLTEQPFEPTPPLEPAFSTSTASPFHPIHPLPPLETTVPPSITPEEPTIPPFQPPVPDEPEFSTLPPLIPKEPELPPLPPSMPETPTHRPRPHITTTALPYQPISPIPDSMTSATPPTIPDKETPNHPYPPIDPGEPDYSSPPPSIPGEPEYPTPPPSIPGEPEYPTPPPSIPGEPEYPIPPPNIPEEPELPPHSPPVPGKTTRLPHTPSATDGPILTPSPTAPPRVPGIPQDPDTTPTPHVPVTPGRRPPPSIMTTQRPRNKNKLKLIIKICKNMLLAPIGCVQSEFLSYFNDPLNFPTCRLRADCVLSRNMMRKLLCECSQLSRMNDQNSFAITNKGQCFGNSALHKISKSRILPVHMCRRSSGLQCQGKDYSCIGDRNTVFIYSNV